MNQPINLNITNLKPSATLVINERSNELVAKGKKIYKLGFGQSPFPVPETVVNALKENAHQKDYLPVKGLFPLRQAIANYHHRKFEINCSADDVLIGPGSKELLFLLQMIYQGKLLLPQPSWVSYEPQAHLANKEFHWLSTKQENGYLLDGKTLAEYCQKDMGVSKMMILNYPSNPAGSTLTITQLKEVASVARKHKILIISDEIYGDVHHTGQHKSIAKYYPEGTIVSSGLSKWCGAGGWRLGTFVFPKELRWLLDKMAVVASETFTTTSAPIQYAAVKAYQGGTEIEEYLTHSRIILGKVAQACSQLLLAINITHPAPTGGFYLMPNFNFYKEKLNGKAIFTSHQLCEAILKETGVALLPLSAFGFPNNYLGARLSYVDFDGAKALHMIKENPAATAKELAPKVLTGIRLIEDWVNQM